MPAVARSLLRRLAVSLAVPGVLGLMLLPQAHSHARESGHSGPDHHETIHRHAEPHRHAGSTTAIGHDEEPELWISATLSSPESPASVRPPDTWLEEPVLSTSAPQESLAAEDALHAHGHDPPWRASLDPRGPPSRLT